MSVPGLFVEYLVVGSMALIWFLPLVGVQFEQGTSIPLGKAAALGPAIYVLGMFIDFIAFWLFSGPTKKYCLKAFARSLIRVQLPQSENNSKYQQLLWLHKNAPEVVKEINMRSSRDRIARGAVVNIFLAYVLQYQGPVSNWAYGTIMWQALWVAAVVVGLLLWVFFEGNSHKFSMAARNMAAKEIEKAAAASSNQPVVVSR